MKKLTISLILFFLISGSLGKAADLSYIFTPKGETGTLAAKKKVVSDFYDAMSKGDPAAIDPFLASIYEVKDSTVAFNSPHSPFDSFSKDIKVRMKALHEALPNLKITVNELFAEGNNVFANLQIEGIQRGPFLGAKPTNKPITIHIFAVFTLSQGKIVQIDEMWNQLAVMKQMGYIIL